MREAARGHARPRALARLVGLIVLSGTMTALIPAVSDARQPDSDGDGVADRVETRSLHTNPRKADTDRDKLRDGVETHVTRTNPRLMDTDKDGLTDGFEVRRSKTKPRRFDTDGDRTGDGLELLMGRNPLRPDRPKKKLVPDPVPPPPPPVPDPPLPVPDPPLVPDLLPPDTSISSGPSGTVATGSASFGFTSSEAGSTFECRLDAGAWGSCTSPKAYSGLANASHTFSVRATDASGNADLTPATRTWTVNVPPPDTTPPNTTINSGPSGTSTSASASFTFTSSESGSTFQCRLDAGSWGSCSSPKAYSGLANGSHTFDVRATDAAANTDATPASAHGRWPCRRRTRPRPTPRSPPARPERSRRARRASASRRPRRAPRSSAASTPAPGAPALAEGLFGPRERLAHVRRARHRRGGQHGRHAGEPDLDRECLTAHAGSDPGSAGRQPDDCLQPGAVGRCDRARVRQLWRLGHPGRRHEDGDRQGGDA